MATSPSGKAGVCNTLIVGSIPTVASKNAFSYNEGKAFFVYKQRLSVLHMITLTSDVAEPYSLWYSSTLRPTAYPTLHGQ